VSKKDWVLQKRECKATAAGSKPSTQPAVTPAVVKKHRAASQPTLGEKVVIHSLVGKPELNRQLGAVSSDLTDGLRYPVKLADRASKLAIKPSNFIE
jgi:hypothetical protein